MKRQEPPKIRIHHFEILMERNNKENNYNITKKRLKTKMQTRRNTKMTNGRSNNKMREHKIVAWIFYKEPRNQSGNNMFQNENNELKELEGMLELIKKNIKKTNVAWARIM